MKNTALFLAILLLSSCMPAVKMEGNAPGAEAESPSSSKTVTISVHSTKTEEEWREKLTPEQYYILREEGTERPFTSPLLNEHRKGTYYTVDCDEPVFRSEQKFESGTGWPSFWAPITPDAVVEKSDTSFGITRVAIESKCGGHLGHVFTDGPEPTGLRYCMNGIALYFVPDEE